MTPSVGTRVGGGVGGWGVVGATQCEATSRDPVDFFLVSWTSAGCDLLLFLCVSSETGAQQRAPSQTCGHHGELLVLHSLSLSLISIDIWLSSAKRGWLNLQTDGELAGARDSPVSWSCLCGELNRKEAVKEIKTSHENKRLFASQLFWIKVVIDEEFSDK